MGRQRGVPGVWGGAKHTSELLQSLESHACEKTLAKGFLEQRQVRRSADGHLIFVVGADLSQLFDQGRMINVEAPEAG